MPTTNYAGVPYPSESDAPDVPVDMQQLAERVDSRLVLRATDPVDRDSRYPNPEPGMLVITNDTTTWIADINGAWHMAYEPTPPWIDCSYAPGYTEGVDAPLQARKTGDRVYLRGSVHPSDGDEVKNVVFAYLPAGMGPSRNMFVTVACSAAGARTTASTRISVHTDNSLLLGDQETGGLPQWLVLDNVLIWTV